MKSALLFMLVPLAVTSTRGMIRRLGGHRWQMLHRLVYVVAGLGVLHFFWSQKKDISEPLIFLVAFSALAAFRLVPLRRKRAAQVRPAPEAAPEG